MVRLTKKPYVGHEKMSIGALKSGQNNGIYAGQNGYLMHSTCNGTFVVCEVFDSPLTTLGGSGSVNDVNPPKCT